MVETSLDKIISKLTVRLKTSDNVYIGSGILYFQDNFIDKIYVLTASHCLFEDGDKFQNLRNDIVIDILKSDFSGYETIRVKTNDKLLFTSEKKDVALLILEKKDVEKISGTVPLISCIKERGNSNNFITKGFPKATFGEEIAVLYPTWLQHFENNRFQLELHEDYLAKFTQGFSGSPVFLIAKNEIYLFGIFTRFRSEEKGKVIYCQYIETINELLEASYLPQISFSYFGQHGLTKAFFENHIENAIEGLGPRFNEKLIFKLPIARIFNDIAKDKTVFKRFENIVDEWILNYGYKKNTDNVHLQEIEKQYDELKNKITNWIKELDYSIENQIEIEWIFDHLQNLNSLIDQKSNELFDLGLREEKEKKEKNISQVNKQDYSYRFPYENERGRLREISRNNNDFIEALDSKVNFKVANDPYLIIKGEAGNGKSHLLGDIAKSRINNNLPTLLLLGQNFLSIKSIWENILTELNLTCSKEELLIELNGLGKQIGSRILILIDAINEGPGKSLWHDRLASFINDFSDYPYISLTISIRTTYIEYVIPENVLKNQKVSIINHEGFKGNEYAALKLFCEYHNLKQPHFPLLAPEFTKPLFLKLICEAVKDSQSKAFPQGFQGISNLFKLYIQSLNLKFEKKRDEYKNRKIVEKAIHSLAFECFGRDRRMLSLDDAIELFDKKYSQFRHLINDLIEENVFIKRIEYDYEVKENKDVVYFAYERFGDFFIAEELLDKYQSVKQIKKAFQKDNEIGKLIDFNYWQHHGLLEAFAVLLPEKYNIEIFEVFDWVFTDETDKDVYQNENKENVNKFFFDSLNWRKIESIDNVKITDWLNSKNFRNDEDVMFLKLIELAPIIGHPFNSDRLFRVLKRFKMPKRDSFWQKHMLWFNAYDDYDVAYPICRLIDWSWSTGISSNIDYETARLTGQTLTWLLASTNRKLRDQTTKALVNLLEQQPEALLAILKAFKNIDDLYILERLYAVVYGCVLRTEKNENIIKISKTVYNYVFKKGNPPAHLLLRDYARNTIEYAIYKNPSLKFNLDLVRPPYKSKMPNYYPSEEEIKKFEIKTKGFDQKNIRMNNMISHSVIHWDFGRYVVDSNLGHFHSVPFTFDEEYNSFLITLSRKQRGSLRNLNSILKVRSKYTNYNLQYYSVEKKTLIENYLIEINDLLERTLEFLKKEFSDVEIEFIEKKIIPVLEKKYKKGDKYNNSIDEKPIRRWIVNRVFELGYDYKIHGSYDISAENYNDRSENKVERIGKKYQWIALFEILASITDNYKVYDDWSGKQTFYKGPWQLYCRDIDPAFTRRIIQSSDDEIEQEVDFVIQKRNDKPRYNNWNQNDADWVENLIDLPSIENIIKTTDDNSTTWLLLKRSIKWKQPKPVGEEKYFGRRKELSFFLQAFLVNKKDKSRAIRLLTNKNLYDIGLPESSNPLQLINREKFWSPAYVDLERETKWFNIDNLNLKVIKASTYAVGEMGDDNSDAHSYYDMPCKTIFEGMCLNYAPLDGEFKNDKGEIIVKDIDYKNLIINKNKLVSFLENNNLEIFWTLRGEKLSYQSNDWDNNFWKYIFGIYYLQNNEIKGNINSFNRD